MKTETELFRTVVGYLHSVGEGLPQEDAVPLPLSRLCSLLGIDDGCIGADKSDQLNYRAITLTAAKYDFDLDAAQRALRSARIRRTKQQIRAALGRWEAHLADMERREHNPEIRMLERRLLTRIRDCTRPKGKVIPVSKGTRIGPRPWNEMSAVEQAQFEARLATMSMEQRAAATFAQLEIDLNAMILPLLRDDETEDAR